MALRTNTCSSWGCFWQEARGRLATCIRLGGAFVHTLRPFFFLVDTGYSMDMLLLYGLV